MNRLSVNEVEIQDNEQLREVRFSNQKNDEGRYFIIRRNQLSIDKDIDPSMFHVYFENDEPSLSTFGGIISITFRPNVVALEFTPKAATELGCESELLIDCKSQGYEWDKVKLTLKKILKGQCKCVDDSKGFWGLVKAIIVGPATPRSEKLVAPVYLGAILSFSGLSVGWDHYGPLGGVIGFFCGLGFIFLVMLLLVGPLRFLRSNE